MLPAPFFLVKNKPPFGANLCAAVCLFCMTALVSIPAQALSPSQALAHVRLAQQDAKTGKIDHALRRLEWLLLNDADNANRSKTYQKALRQLTEQRRLSFGAAAALAPSSNVARGGTETPSNPQNGLNYTLDPDASESGIGLRITANGTYRRAYAAGRDISARLDFSTALYDTQTLRNTTQKLTFAHRWLAPGARYTLSSFASRTTYPDVQLTFPDTHTRISPNNWMRGVAFDTVQMLDNGHVAKLGLIWSDRTYDETRRAYAQGATTFLSGSYTVPAGKRGKVTVLGSVTGVDLQSKSFSYDGYTLGTNYSQTNGGGLSWSVGYSATWHSYDAVFPLFSYARSDTSQTVSLNLSHRNIQIGNATPRINCFAKKQTSNVVLYSYKTVDCSLTLGYDF
jgi:hypothetical protein